jgi:hypothetical protein
MNQQLKTILKNPNHPLKFLVDPKTRNWRGRFPKSDVAPSAQAGHATTRASGAAERFLLEDADFNQLTASSEAKGVIFAKEGVDIGGVHVERRTALQYENMVDPSTSRPYLAPGTVANAPSTLGWKPE